MNAYRWSVLIAATAYVAMILVNVLANVLPIGGVTTGAVSDGQMTLFAPTGFTFSVWGVIYLLLGWYVVTQGVRVFVPGSTVLDPAYLKLNLLFAVSSLANVAWIFAWHHLRFGLSVILMFVILGALIGASFLLAELSGVTKAAFGVYFGWITVAAIANVATWLVSRGVPNVEVSATLRTIAVMYVGLILATATILVQKNIGYGLVVLWAFVGILVRHVDPAQFADGFRGVRSTAIVAIVVLLAADAFTVFRLLRER